MINIGLDFDGTVDADPELWQMFVALAQKRGHVVYVTTARHANNLKDIEQTLPGVEIIPSGGLHKEPACAAVGVVIDVWIDDMPEIIKAETWQPRTQH